MSAKLQRLTEYLLSKDFVPKENLESWVELCTDIPASVDLGHCYQLCRLHYRCSLYIERYIGDSRLITAWIAAWLKDHDPDRDYDRLPDPDIDIQILDASGTQWDVDVSIEFIEPVLIEPDELNGNIDWNGRKWRLIDQPVIDIAEELDRLDPADPGEEKPTSINSQTLRKSRTMGALP